MLFRHLLLTAITAIGCFIGGVSANEMKKVFDYYAQGSPGTYSTENMKHWTGASFSGRNALNEPDLYQLPTISMGGSCKGLDFHASGFGLVTKDEIVQMARGIAQGAPGYFFNMAIGAVCSSCLQNINEFMRKLEQFNQLTRNSCENFWNAATNSNGQPFDRAVANSDAKGKLLDNATGFLKGWGDQLDEYYPSSDPGRGFRGTSLENAKAVLNDNVVYSRIKNAFKDGYITNKFPGTDITIPELAMSLYGTVITQVKDGVTDEIIIDTMGPSGNLTPLKLLTLPKDSAEKMTFWQCDPETGVPVEDRECLNMHAVEDIEFMGVEVVFRHMLLGDGTDIGILRKIQNRENLTPAQVDFIEAFRLPYLRIAASAKGEQLTQLGEMFAIQMGSKFIKDLYQETETVLRRALRVQPKGGDKDKVDYKAEVEKYMEESKAALKLMDDDVEKRLSEISTTVQVLHALKELNKLEATGGRE